MITLPVCGLPTLLHFCPSYLSRFGSFFISWVAENLFYWSSDHSHHYLLCKYGVPIGGGEHRVLLLCHLTRLTCFVIVFALFLKSGLRITILEIWSFTVFETLVNPGSSYVDQNLQMAHALREGREWSTNLKPGNEYLYGEVLTLEPTWQWQGSAPPPLWPPSGPCSRCSFY